MNHAAMDDIGKLTLRVALGVLILLHGIAKLSGVGGLVGMVEGYGLPGFTAYGVYLGEIVGPILLIIGWYARAGAILIVINMLFAIGLAHIPHGQFLTLASTGGWALELQGIYLFTALALALIGPGQYAINDKPAWPAQQQA